MEVSSCMNDSPRPSWTLIAAVIAFNLAVGFSQLHFWPAYTLNSEIFSSDTTLNLCVINTLNSGGRLYSDIFYQYGPLFPTLFRHFSQLFANKVIALFWFDLMLSVFAQLVVLKLACRYIQSRLLLSLIIVCCSLRFRCFFGNYTLIERFLLFAAVLFWTSYPNRNTPRNLLVGAWFGALQWLKFGVGPMLAVASLILDLLEYRHRQKSDFMLLVRSYVIIMLSAGIFEFFFIVWAFLSYSSDIAWEMVFPIYFLESYASFGGFGNPFRFMDLGYLVYKQLPILTGLAMTVVLLAQIYRQRRSVEGRTYLLLPVFYILGCLSLFRQHYLLWQYDYAVLFAFFSLLHVKSFPIARLILVFLFFWPLAISAKNLVFPRPPVCTEKVVFPNGEYLYFPPDQARNHRQLIDIMQSQRGFRDQNYRGIFFQMGFYYFYDIAPVGRQVYFLTGFPKPFDAGLLTEQNSRIGWCVWPSATFLDDVERWFKQANPFPKSVFQQHFDRARLTRIGNAFYLYEFIPIHEATGSAK